MTTAAADQPSWPPGTNAGPEGGGKPVTGAAPPLSGLRLGAALLAVAACAVGQWYIRAPVAPAVAGAPAGTFALPQYVANLLFVGASIVAALLLGRPSAGLRGATPRALPPPGRRGLLAGAAVVLGIGVIAFATYRLATQWATAFDLAAPLDILGWVICTTGLALWERRRFGSRAHTSMARWEVALLIGIVALGFFLRFYRYTYFPPPYGVAAVEEPQEGEGAYGIWQGGLRPWEFVGDRWLPVPFFALFGVSLTTLRLPFTLLSGFTVLALYCLLRQLVSRPAALFCTALFAACHWHLMYARIAHAVFPSTFIVVVVLALCVRAHRRGGLAVYPWIGFLSGYTLYTYAGYRGTTLFVSLFLALSFLSHLWEWRRAANAEARAAARSVVGMQATGLALFALALLLTVVPLASALRLNPTYYFEAANRSLVDTEYYTSDVHSLMAQRLIRLEATARIFNHLGDDSATFNLPGEPMLDPIAGTLMMLGLAYAVVWGRYRFQGFFALTFLVLLVLGTTFVHNLDVRRLQCVIPLIFVLIAFFVDRLWQAVSAKLGRPGHLGMALLAVIVAGSSLVVNYDVYFHRWINNRIVRTAFQNYYTVAIRYLHTIPHNGYMLFVSEALNLFGGSDFRWLRGDTIPGMATTDLTPLFTGNRGPWDGRELHVVIQEPNDRESVARLLQARFPEAVCQDIESPEVSPVIWMTACRVPPSGVVRTVQGGVRARYFKEHAAVPFLERIEPAISFAFFPNQCLSYPGVQFPCYAEWEGTWNVPQPGTYRLAAELRGGEVQLSLDDHPASGPVELGAGPHVIRVQARLARVDHNGVRVRWRRAETEQWELVRFASFGEEAGGQ